MEYFLPVRDLEVEAYKINRKRRSDILRAVRDFAQDAVDFLKEKNIFLMVGRWTKESSIVHSDIFDGSVWRPEPDKIEIYLASQFSNKQLQSQLLHEVHHARQIFNNLAFPTTYVPPADLILWNAFLEADAQADVMIRAFKALLSGKPNIISSISDSYQKMWDAISEGYNKDPQTLQDGRLRRMAFDAWFLGGHVPIYAQDVMDLKWKLFKTYSHFPASPLTAADLAKIGTTENEGFNYLLIPGFRPLTDDYYRTPLYGIQKQQLDKLTAEWKHIRRPAALGKGR